MEYLLFVPLILSQEGHKRLLILSSWYTKVHVMGSSRHGIQLCIQWTEPENIFRHRVPHTVYPFLFRRCTHTPTPYKGNNCLKRSGSEVNRSWVLSTKWDLVSRNTRVFARGHSLCHLPSTTRETLTWKGGWHSTLFPSLMVLSEKCLKHDWEWKRSFKALLPTRR